MSASQSWCSLSWRLARPSLRRAAMSRVASSRATAGSSEATTTERRSRRSSSSRSFRAPSARSSHSATRRRGSRSSASAHDAGGRQLGLALGAQLRVLLLERLAHGGHAALQHLLGHRLLLRRQRRRGWRCDGCARRGAAWASGRIGSSGTGGRDGRSARGGRSAARAEAGRSAPSGRGGRSVAVPAVRPAVGRAGRPGRCAGGPGRGRHRDPGRRPEPAITLATRAALAPLALAPRPVALGDERLGHGLERRRAADQLDALGLLAGALRRQHGDDGDAVDVEVGVGAQDVADLGAAGQQVAFDHALAAHGRRRRATSRCRPGARSSAPVRSSGTWLATVPATATGRPPLPPGRAGFATVVGVPIYALGAVAPRIDPDRLRPPRRRGHRRRHDRPVVVGVAGRGAARRRAADPHRRPHLGAGRRRAALHRGAVPPRWATIARSATSSTSRAARSSRAA